ncbi:MAG: hypothetical protein RRY24_06620, partial [Clostridiales bacterium]
VERWRGGEVERWRGGEVDVVRVCVCGGMGLWIYLFMTRKKTPVIANVGYLTALVKPEFLNGQIFI